jgi:hypothetical protein
MWREGATLSFPSSTAMAAGTYFGPNFQAQAVPEPSVMVALGMASLAVLRRRRKA